MTLTPGDIFELRLAEGIAYGQVLATGPAYPPAVAFLSSLCAAPLPDPVASLGESEVTILLVPLTGTDDLRVVGRAVPRLVPQFRVPVRDRAGRVLYDWLWDGDGISLPPDAETARLPVREIVSLRELAGRLGSQTSPD